MKLMLVISGDLLLFVKYLVSHVEASTPYACARSIETSDSWRSILETLVLLTISCCASLIPFFCWLLGCQKSSHFLVNVLDISKNIRDA